MFYIITVFNGQELQTHSTHHVWHSLSMLFYHSSCTKRWIFWSLENQSSKTVWWEQFVQISRSPDILKIYFKIFELFHSMSIKWGHAFLLFCFVEVCPIVVPGSVLCIRNQYLLLTVNFWSELELAPLVSEPEQIIEQTVGQIPAAGGQRHQPGLGTNFRKQLEPGNCHLAIAISIYNGCQCSIYKCAEINYKKVSV